MNPETAGGGLKNISSQNICRNQVRSALHALKLQAENVRQRLDRERFRESRHAFDERMTPREHHKQQLVHGVGLPNNDLRKFPTDMRRQVRSATFHEGLASAGFR